MPCKLKIIKSDSDEPISIINNNVIILNINNLSLLDLYTNINKSLKFFSCHNFQS